jgi:hypothetical protein
MDTDTTTPSEDAPEPKGFSGAGSDTDHIFLTGNASIKSMAAGGVTHTSDTPLPLRMVDPAILSNWDQPQPQLPQRPQPFVPGGPAEPPFPPPTNNDQVLTSVRIATAVKAGVAATGFAAGAPVHNLVARDIIIGRAVATNQVAIQLAAVSLLNALDAKLETLHEARSNSEDAAVYENLKRLVEAFLAAQEKTDEKPVVESTLSLAEGFRNWWFKDHESICKKTMNIGLFTGGLTVCALAGALGVSDASIVTVGVLVGGKDVVGALTALAKMLPGKD